MSSPASAGLVARLLREMERNAVRARNGIRYLSGRRMGARGPTPCDLVWSQGKAGCAASRATASLSRRPC